MDITSIRLPYIFGDTKGLTPVWKLHTDGMHKQEVVSDSGGKSAAITVSQVAQAAVGAMENGIHRGCYPVATYELKIRTLYELGLKYLGQEDTTKIVEMDFEDAKASYQALNEQAEQAGLEYGMDMVKSGYITSQDFTIDPSETMELLNIKEEDVFSQIDKAMQISAEMTLAEHEN